MSDPDQSPGIAGSAALLTLARLSSAAALFVLTIIAARLLSPEDVGSAAVGQVIGTAGALLANGGINIATIFFLRRRRDEQHSLVGRLMPLAIGSSVMALALVLASAPIVFGPILGSIQWALLVSAGALATSMIAYEFFGALLLGIGESRRYVALEVVRGWASLAWVTGLLLLARDSFALVLGVAFGFLSATLLGIVRVGSRASLRPRYDSSLTREALGFGARGQVGNILQFLGVRLDLLLVPALLSLEQAGIYFIAARVSDLVGQGATASASFLFPYVAGQQDHRDSARTERVVRITLLVTGFGAIVVAIAAGPLLEIAFGDAYTAGTPALLVLLAAAVPLSIGRLLAADLKGRGRPGIVSAAALVSVVATVALDLALIPAWGIVGAAVASLVAYSLMSAALLLAYRAATAGRVTSLVPGPADLRDLRTLVDRRVARRGSTDR